MLVRQEEEEKQSRVHFDFAKHVIDIIVKGEEQVSQTVAIQVLKPFLEDYITQIKQR